MSPTPSPAIDEAIITAAGVNIAEVDPRSMESKLIQGLYFAGRVFNRKCLGTCICGCISSGKNFFVELKKNACEWDEFFY
ncbi:MAG: hypothetical protein FJ119_14250 [Deltaproteobacteria bacterium]|nr:hypothetical protein [Deltaproteobacteria bacterium]